MLLPLASPGTLITHMPCQASTINSLQLLWDKNQQHFCPFEGLRLTFADLQSIF